MDLLLRHGPMTKGEMRTRTGMSQPSILQLFDRLQADDLIEPAGAVTGRRGPQAQLFRVNPTRARVAVVRVDLRETVAAVADMTGALTAVVSAPAPAESGGPADQVLDTFRRSLASAGLTVRDVSRLVVAATGVVDPLTGDLGYVLGHPKWRGALKAPLEAELGLPIHVENQVNLLGLAEVEADQATDDVVVLSLGPAGGAAAVVIDGKLRRGTFGAAGEVAYLPTGAEPVALGAANSVTGGLATLMREVPWPEGSPIPAGLIEPVARIAASLCAVVDPSRIVLSGPYGRRGGSQFASLVEASLRRTWPMPVAVVPTAVSGDAALLGAALAGLTVLRDRLWGPVTGLTQLSPDRWRTRSAPTDSVAKRA
jgi:predicted NBD/HSP70 family sugar kinase